jgi:transcriptional regulator GlxA family with amidase domain
MPCLQGNTRQTAILGFDGVQSLDVVGPMEVFALANLHSPPSLTPYSITLASLSGGEIVTHAGLRLAGVVALKDLPDDIDTIVIAGGSEETLRAAIKEQSVLHWLTDRALRTRRIASVCTGAFVLAASGLLDGRRATTHWNQCALLQRLCPAVKVEPNSIFIAEPPFYTSAGVTAGIDLCLSLVEVDCGSAVALAVARELVLFMRRPGGQSQFSAGLQIQADATPRVRALLTAIIEDPSGELSGAAMADRLAMTERTFSRNFRKETGFTPMQFVQAARVERAKALLETSDWPLVRVAGRAGFGSVDALHRAFLKRVGTTPGFYRDRFGPVRQV